MVPQDEELHDSEAGDPSADRLAERLAEASALAEQELWQDAFETLIGEELSHPDDPTLLCMLGVAATEVGAGGMAYDFFRRCVSQDPEDPVLLTTAGAALARLDDPDAERVLRLAALTAPHLPAARLNYGAYLAREGLFDAAAAELEAARDLDTEDTSIRYELATTYLLSGRGDDGLLEFAEALARTPDDTWIQALYGLALFEAGRTEESAEQLLAASLERFDDWEIQAATALATAGEGWTDQAWEAIARADLAPGVDESLVREVEDRLELGSDAAGAYLRDEIAAPLLRARLLSRD